MDKRGRIIKGCLIGLLAVCIALPVFAIAREEVYAELPERTGASPGITVEVPFEAAIKPSTVNRNNVYVMDEQGNRVAISREMGAGNKSIIVSPLERYEAGKTYTLYIRKAVKYESGSDIKNGLKMRFTIARVPEEPLPKVGSGENLKKLLEEAAQRDDYIMYGSKKLRNGITTADVADGAAGTANAASEGAAPAAADYSTTNVQVEGVDEADIVKTDGRYIYQVNGGRIVIVEARPAERMSIKKIIELDEDSISPTELYLDDRHLVVIGSSHSSIPVNNTGARKILPSKKPFHYRDSTVKMLVYDITDINNIKKSREIELEGDYLSSRKIGYKLYLVSNKQLNYHRIYESGEVNDTPSYKDTAVKDDYINVDYGEIEYFPGSVDANYMIVAGVDLSRPKDGVNVSTYLGAGESIYASSENLYAAVTKYNAMSEYMPGPVIRDSAVPSKPAVKVSDRETVIYRFALNNGKLDYTGKGQVPGSILNQFSMDEYKGYFRIATTKGSLFGEGESISKNNLYVLDSGMEICGSLEDIAPGERIYSARFMGDRAYMVTFKKVDPLFVIDLKDASKPAVLGALKIPGYSDYLHPYDENHIIGFGKDTIELPLEVSGLKGDNTRAYYQGMKIALFDVSDVSKPKEKFKEIIGDRGTESELLRDHKALLFSKEKGLMAFPVTVMEIKEGGNVSEGSMPVYGSFTFQGAYIYGVSLEEGFKLRARISHLSSEDYLKAGEHWYDSSKNVERIIYIGDDIYTISKGMIKVNDIKDMKEKGSLQIP